MRTEFGLAKPKLEWQALLLLPKRESGSAKTGLAEAGLAKAGLARLLKVFFLFCFPPIAASAAHLW